jgi:phosphohistidine phosphatase
MRLYFLRHADALSGENDALRPLSAKGKKEMRAVTRFLQRAGIAFDAIYSSPLLRARETAEWVLATTKQQRPLRLKLENALLNETSPGEFDQWLKRLPDQQEVLLVGHEPTLSERVAHLLGLRRPDALKLPKAGLACLETEDRKSATLRFLVSPKVL